MQRSLKELTLLMGGLALGVVLMLFSSVHAAHEGFGTFVWGWPLAWHWEGDLMVGGTSIFGVYFGDVMWFRFEEDLGFWLVVSLVVSEVPIRLAASYAHEALSIIRSRRVRTRWPRLR
jgi:hypothetical protein